MLVLRVVHYAKFFISIICFMLSFPLHQSHVMGFNIPFTQAQKNGVSLLGQVHIVGQCGQNSESALFTLKPVLINVVMLRTDQLSLSTTREL